VLTFQCSPELGISTGYFVIFPVVITHSEGFLGNRELLMVMGYIPVMFFILTSIWLTLMSPCDVYTTQPDFIYSCTSCWGGYTAEEVAKDEKNLAAVEKVGSDSIPLVVETLR